MLETTRHSVCEVDQQCVGSLRKDCHSSHSLKRTRIHAAIP